MSSYSSGVDSGTAEPRNRALEKDNVVNDSKDQPSAEEIPRKNDKIYGKTPSGTVFAVPHTEDMVTNLLDPRVSKSISDIAIVSVLASYIALYLITPRSARIPVFLVMFGFWRLAYNAGIGLLLDGQSKTRMLTRLAQQYKLFDSSSKGWFVHDLIRKDLTAKMDSNEYDFYKAPLELNTWLLFRDLVDLILMSDFTCYMLLAVACSSATDHPWFIVFGRWAAGISLFVFNLWVKLDAHRVVKDYAWYWGDFFFLEDVQLTFDGVFEMAPHPMYSIGYAGYYGICLMTASYTLFAASVLAHACQFAFLILVENPHIEKTYNPPKQPTRPRKISDVAGSSSPGGSINGDESLSAAVFDDENAVMRTSQRPMLIFKGFTVTRASDILLVLMALYYSILYFVPDNKFWNFVVVGTALGWRIFHNFGLGYLLSKQSQSKAWTRVFLKFGHSPLYAYQQWQALYNASTVMSYVSFAVCAIRLWNSPIGLVPYWPFRYIIGAMLISLQIWTSYSIYESLGDYGWFYGDFFFPQPQKLTYSGIYRYLNNPERLFGIAGVWGTALLTTSLPVAILAFLWTFGGMAFIRFVEQPHMQKLYGGQLRNEAGVTKTIRQATKLAPPFESKVRQLQGSIDKVISETGEAVESFLGFNKTKRSLSGVKEVVNDTRVLLKQYPARLTIVRVSDDICADASQYSLTIAPESLVSSGTEDNSGSLKVEYGTPIRVKWTSDTNNTPADWIGLYRLTDNKSKEVTRISSRGRWVGLTKEAYDEDHTGGIVSRDGDTQGEVIFENEALFWERGVYEFRYHYNRKHNVLAVSQPFEIVTCRRDIGDNEQGLDTLANELLDLVQKCCRGTSVWAPTSVEDVWELNDKQAVSRLAYGVKEIYGIDLAPSVFQVDENVLQLATRLVKVKKALQPFDLKA
uniref:Phosphatidylethanolamine N-methyltransferase n=1 Tax=Blastobotrys adeninivorans TaxID=409370 RepID=A0A060THC6_BLAAD